MTGHKTANKSIRPSGLPPCPASVVLDRIYIEGGTPVTGGLNVKINQKEQLTKLGRGSDYATSLGWISMRPIAFYDVSDERAWLVDGASALLHLVRVSLYLDEVSIRCPYDWVPDWQTKLVDTFDDCDGGLAAFRTLKSWDNRNQPIYIKKQTKLPDGEIIREYATFEDRVSEIMHSLEVLIDREVHLSFQGGIRISQTLDHRKFISGFDVHDMFERRPIHSRVKYFNSWGTGWYDFLPAVGALTFFGTGFGDLIRPDLPHEVCAAWQRVPTGKDYMAATVTTLKVTCQEHLSSMHLGHGISPIAGKMCWVSYSHPSKTCGCLRSSPSTIRDHMDPVQFLISRRLMWKPRGSEPIDIDTVKEKGAVVFAIFDIYSMLKKSRADQGIDESLPMSPANSSTTQGSASGTTVNSTASASASASSNPEVPADATFSVPNTSPPRGDTQRNVNTDRKGKGSVGKFLSRLEKLAGG